MTTNQIVAMLFPLLGLVVAAGVAVFARKPWKKRKPVGSDDEIVDALHRAEIILSRARGTIVARGRKIVEVDPQRTL